MAAHGFRRIPVQFEDRALNRSAASSELGPLSGARISEGPKTIQGRLRIDIERFLPAMALVLAVAPLKALTSDGRGAAWLLRNSVILRHDG